MRALIVEDDLVSRLLLQTFLSRYGACDVAVNGREAVQAFGLALEEGSPYNLICMDITMPEMDGKEAVKRVRALEQANGAGAPGAVKIIMTTASNDIREVIQSFQELCDAYLFKPIDTGKLLHELNALRLIA
jgi:two-component system chemotaxis response regulator CheY